jgi:predicted ATPase
MENRSMPSCPCTARHHAKCIVLTGGPGAGKTATLELVRQTLCEHVVVLPESAGIVFGGGFPRSRLEHAHKASQRAIFYVQRELEAAVADNAAILLCDRGTVDGLAYWPGPEDLFAAVHTSLDEQLARYDAVIHLRTPSAEHGYNNANPLRTESAAEAAAIDQRILDAWARHPRRFVIESSVDFISKASRALELLRAEVPACCMAAARRASS